MLADCLAREPIGSGTSVLDLCTGSGVLALAAAELGAPRVVATDVSRLALLAVRLNARLNRVKVRAVRGDLFAAVAGQRFDLIVSNPPYVPSPNSGLPRRGLARAWEGGPRGRTFIDRICASVREHLNPGGALLLVQSEVCGEHETLGVLRSQGLEAEVVARHVGALGPRMRERAQWLREEGLLSHSHEEVIVVRAQLATTVKGAPRGRPGTPARA